MDVSALLDHLRDPQKNLLVRMGEYLHCIGRIPRSEVVSVGELLLEEAKEITERNGNAKQLQEMVEKIKKIVDARKEGSRQADPV